MFGVIPTWKVLVGAMLSVLPFAGGLATYEASKKKGWKRPAAAAGVYGALQLGVSYLNLHLMTPSIGDIAEIAENWAALGSGSTGSLYMPRGGGLPKEFPMQYYVGKKHINPANIGLIDATYSMARRPV